MQREAPHHQHRQQAGTDALQRSHPVEFCTSPCASRLISTPPTKDATPIAADCTEAFSVMKVPRNGACAAEAMMAMPGIMRPLMQVKNRVDTIKTAHMGRPSVNVVATMGTITSTAITRNKATLPRRSVKTPISRALNKVAMPPHK